MPCANVDFQRMIDVTSELMPFFGCCKCIIQSRRGVSLHMPWVASFTLQSASLCVPRTPQPELYLSDGSAFLSLQDPSCVPNLRGDFHSGEKGPTASARTRSTAMQICNGRAKLHGDSIFTLRHILCPPCLATKAAACSGIINIPASLMLHPLFSLFSLFSLFFLSHFTFV